MWSDIDSGEPSTLDLEETLLSRLDSCSVDIGRVPSISDKWILSSALQKLIRRGQASAAIGVGIRLHQLDPAYLARRLPIIAVEDIALGDLAACFDVVTVCSSTRWWRSDPQQAIRFAISSLAEAVKCRAACDAYCLAQVSTETPRMMSRLLASTVDELVAVAVDLRRGQLERSNALRVLGGISVRHGGRYEVLSRCSSSGLDRVAVALAVPPLVRWLMARHPRTAGLAAMLPIAVEAAETRSVQAGGDFPHSLEFVEGVPLCAVDMFSEVGRGVLRDFFRASQPVRSFAVEHVVKGSHIRLLNMAMFHVESSHLNAFLASPGLQALREETERSEMTSLGMKGGGVQRGELYDILTAEASELANRRRHRLLQMNEMVEDDHGLDFSGRGWA